MFDNQSRAGYWKWGEFPPVAIQMVHSFANRKYYSFNFLQLPYKWSIVLPIESTTALRQMMSHTAALYMCMDKHTLDTYTCAYTHMCTTHTHTHTHTHTPWALRLPVYPNPLWKVFSCPTKGCWVTSLQALNLGQAGEPHRRVDGLWTIAETRVRRSSPGASTTSCIVWCVYMMNPVIGLQDQHEGPLTPPALHSTTRSGTGVLPS